MIVELLAHQDGSHCTRIKSAISLINGTQRFFRLRFREDRRLAATHGPVSPRQTCESFEQEVAEHPFILVTEDPLNDNWFSHEYRRSSIITLADWERLYAPPSLKTYLMYQIAQSVLSFSGDLSEEMLLNLLHEPPVGCMFDLAAHKPNIKYGMVGGNICPSCEGQLRRLGISAESLDAVKHILSLVRAEAIGTPMLLDPAQVFVVMRFTRHDENDNAWTYGIKAGIESCGFNPVRADEHVESAQIFDKVFRQINKSRLVVVKVDENNLNVYFELGLAMGLDKDVLLISESSLVLGLPSDLRNWECLTYPKGNYAQLKASVHEFLRHTYHIDQE